MEMLDCPCNKKGTRGNPNLYIDGSIRKQCLICFKHYKLHIECAKTYWTSTLHRKDQFKATAFIPKRNKYYCKACYNLKISKCSCGKLHNGGETKKSPRIMECGGNESGEHHWFWMLKCCFEKLKVDIPMTKRQFLCQHHAEQKEKEEAISMADVANESKENRNMEAISTDPSSSVEIEEKKPILKETQNKTKSEMDPKHTNRSEEIGNIEPMTTDPPSLGNMEKRNPIFKEEERSTDKGVINENENQEIMTTDPSSSVTEPTSAAKLENDQPIFMEIIKGDKSWDTVETYASHQQETLGMKITYNIPNELEGFSQESISMMHDIGRKMNDDFKDCLDLYMNNLKKDVHGHKDWFVRRERASKVIAMYAMEHIKVPVNLSEEDHLHLFTKEMHHHMCLHYDHVQ